MSSFSLVSRAAFTTATLLGAALAGTAVAPEAHAATMYWDGTGSSWNATGSWSTNSTLPFPDPLAVPGASDIASFNNILLGSAQTVNLDANQSALGLVFDNTFTTTLRGGGTNRMLTLGTSGIAVNAGAGAVTLGSSTAGQNVAISLAGAQSWVGSGTGALTVVNGVSIGSGGNQALTLSGTHTGNAITGVVSNGANILGVTKTGSGTWTLSGNNTYSGATTVSEGTLVVVRNDTGAPGGGNPYGAVSVAANATLTLVENGSGMSNVSNYQGASGGGVFNVQGTANTFTLPTDLTGGGTMLTGTVSLTGTINVQSGILVAQAGGNWAGTTAAMNVSSGAIFLCHAADATVGALSGSGNIGTGWPTPQTLTVGNGGGSGSFGGTLYGNGTGAGNVSIQAGVLNLTKTGGGTQVLTGTNLYTGATTINGGVLSVGTLANGGSSSNIGASTSAAANLVFANGGTLQYTGGSVTTDRAFTLNAGGGTLEVVNSGTTLTFANTVATANAGTNILTKTGAGKLVLGGTADNASLYLAVSSGSGNVELAKSSTASVHAVAGIASIASGTTVKLTGTGGDQIWGGSAAGNAGVNGLAGTLDLNGRSEGTSNFNGSATGVVTSSVAGAVTWTVGESNATSTYAGVIQDGAGSVALTKVGAGTLTLSGASTFTGALTIAGSFGGSHDTPGIKLAAGASLATDTINLGVGGSVANMESILANGAVDQMTNAVVNFNPSSGVTPFCIWETWGFNQSVKGLNAASNGVSIIENTNGTASPSSIVTLTGGGTYSFGGTFRNGNASTIGLTVNMAPGGAQTLSGAGIVYSGATLVSAGTLKLTDTSGLNTSIANNAVVEVNAATAGDSWTNASGKTLSGAGTWNKTGAGRARFVNGTWTTSGQINVQAGTLSNDGNSCNWSGNTANIDVSSGAILDLYADAIVCNALTGSGVVQNNFGNLTGQSGATASYERLTIGVAGGSGSFSGVIRNNATNAALGSGVGVGGVEVVKTGAGTQTLSGQNTYTGATTVNGGTLALDLATNSDVIKNGNNLTLAGGTLDFSGGSVAGGKTQTFGAVTISSGANRITNSNYTYTAGSGTAGGVNLGTLTRTGGTLDIANLSVDPAADVATGTANSWIRASGVTPRPVLNASITTNNGQDLVAVNSLGNLVVANNVDYLQGATAFSNQSSSIARFIASGTYGVPPGTSNGTQDIWLDTASQTINGAGHSYWAGMNNAYSSATVVDVGHFSATTTLHLGVEGAILANSGGALTIGKTVGTSGTLTAGGTVSGTAGTISTNTNGTITINSVVANNGSGTVGLSVNGTGTTVLAAANTYTGATTLDGGILSVGTIGNGGVAGNLGQAGVAVGNLVFNGGTLRYTGATASSNRGFTVNATGGAVEVSSSTTLTFTGGNTGSGTLTKTGAGTLELNGAGFWSAAATTAQYNVTDGVLTMDATGVASVSQILAGGWAVSAGKTFNLNYGTAGGTLLLRTGTLSGAGTVNLTGAGCIDFWSTGGSSSSLSGFSGQLNIGCSSLSIQTATLAQATTTAKVNIASGKFLDLRTQGFACDTLTGTGTVADSHSLGGTETLTVGTANGTSQFDGVIKDSDAAMIGYVAGGSIALTKTGTGTFTLTNVNNSYTGATTVSGGTLEVTVNNALGTTAGTTTVNAGGTLKLTDVTYATAEALTLNGTGAGGVGALLNSGTSTYAGAITVASHATIHNGGGTLTLTGGVVKNGTTVTFAGAGITNINTVGLSGASPNSDVVVNGLNLGGTVNLNALSTFNGPVSVTNTGSLFVNTTMNTTGGNVSVDGTSTLGGTGTITTTGTVGIAIGGQITAGQVGSLSGTDADNILHITAGTFDLNGTYLADLNYNGELGNQADGDLADVISVAGDVDLSGSTLALSGTNAPAAAGAHYAIKLFEVTSGSITGDWGSITGLNTASGQTVVRWGNAYYLVPEPASFALLGLGSLLLLRRPSRRRRTTA